MKKKTIKNLQKKHPIDEKLDTFYKLIPLLLLLVVLTVFYHKTQEWTTVFTNNKTSVKNPLRGGINSDQSISYDDLVEISSKPSKTFIISEKSLRRKGVKFAKTTMNVFLKESSFCRCEYGSTARPSMCCCERWTKEVGFCPNNPFGMNHPTRRKTTSIGPINKYIYANAPRTYNIYKRGDAKGAVYTSIESAVDDLVLWQKHVFRNWVKKGNKLPKNDEEYKVFLKKVVWNPYITYYKDKNGLYNIPSNTKEFNTIYGKFLKKYVERTKRWDKEKYELLRTIGG